LPLYFIGGGLIALFVTALAISFKSIQALTQNHVDSLRYELEYPFQLIKAKYK